MATIIRDPSINIDASVDKLWGIIADDFTEVSNWVDVVKSSQANPATPAGVNGSRHGGRACVVEGLGAIEEKIVAYDNEAHSLSYTVHSPDLPPFLEQLKNSWTVQSLSSGSSTVAIHAEISATGDSGPGSDADGFANAIAETLAGAAQNLKTFAEK
jgi:hypothetical protein